VFWQKEETGQETEKPEIEIKFDYRVIVKKSIPESTLSKSN